MVVGYGKSLCLLVLYACCIFPFFFISFSPFFSNFSYSPLSIFRSVISFQLPVIFTAKSFRRSDDDYFLSRMDALDSNCRSCMTCSSPRRPLFLHALSFECTSKLCGTFLNQFSDYFHIKKMHNTI